MRLPALGLAVLVLLSACTSAGDSAEAPDADSGNVLVDMDGDPADLDALRTLLADDGVQVSAVSLSLPSGPSCADGAAAAAAVLADAGDKAVPISCGPDDLADKVLDAVDKVLVLGPLTNVAAMLGRLSDVPIIVAVGPAGGEAAGGAPANIAADPRATRAVIDDRPLTLVPASLTPNLVDEVVAAWLVIDETLGNFVLEDIEITSAGRLETVEDGATVRRLDSVDTPRLIALAQPGQPEEESAAAATPELRWRIDVGDQVRGFHHRPAVAGDLVIVGGVNGEVHAISLATGELVWTVETDTDELTATGVAFEAGVAVLSRGEFSGVMARGLVAINVDDRSVLWTFDPQTVSPDSGDMSSPAIADGLVYAGTGGGPAGEGATGIIFAADLHSGELVWQRDGKGGASEPLVAGDDLVVGGIDGTLRVLDRHTGALRWERNLLAGANGIASRPLVAEGVVYVTADDGSVHALDQESGEILWRFQETSEPIPASPVLADGRLIVAELFGGTTRALDPKTGEELWATRAVAALGDPVVVGDTVVVTNFEGSGTVAGLDIASGEVLWEFDNPTAIDGSPVVADGVLVYQAGDVYALELP